MDGSRRPKKGYHYHTDGRLMPFDEEARVFRLTSRFDGTNLTETWKFVHFGRGVLDADEQNHFRFRAIYQYDKVGRGTQFSSATFHIQPKDLAFDPVEEYDHETTPFAVVVRFHFGSWLKIKFVTKEIAQKFKKMFTDVCAGLVPPFLWPFLARRANIMSGLRQPSNNAPSPNTNIQDMQFGLNDIKLRFKDTLDLDYFVKDPDRREMLLKRIGIKSRPEKLDSIATSNLDEFLRNFDEAYVKAQKWVNSQDFTIKPDLTEHINPDLLDIDLDLDKHDVTRRLAIKCSCMKCSGRCWPSKD